MQYRTNPKNGDALSALGFGCMRFTKRGGGIDQEKANREMALALETGVNYFDTAYIYPGSEVCLGQFMQAYNCRDRVRVATKLPHYRINRAADIDRFFDEELSRLQTDYVDYYLMHMLNDAKSWQRLCDMGIREWIAERKAAGQIRNIGFSFHGGTLQFKALVDAFDWDFCQMQFNYMDEHSQAGIDGLNYAHEKGLPVIIMEPLRGGRLAGMLPTQAEKVFSACVPGRSNAEWGLRWLWDQEAVTVVLSGMNSLDMVRDNCAAADRAAPGCVTAEEREVYRRAVEAINAGMKVGCTGCRYCMPCPQKVDIPGTFAAWNRSAYDGRLRGMFDYFMCTAMRRDATSAANCVECGKCARHCPQHIPIPQELKKARKVLEGPFYKLAAKAVRLFVKY